MGYNFIPSEISAAFGLEQLKKLKRNIDTRVRNFKFLHNFFSKFSNIVNLPVTNLNARTGWLAFPLTIKNNLKLIEKIFRYFLKK